MIWDFLQRYDESWIWRCTDHHAVTESRRNFAALEECIADAKLYGYTPSDKSTESSEVRTADRPRRRRKSETVRLP